MFTARASAECKVVNESTTFVGYRSIRPRVDPPRVDPSHVRPKCGRSAPSAESLRPNCSVVSP